MSDSSNNKFTYNMVVEKTPHGDIMNIHRRGNARKGVVCSRETFSHEKSHPDFSRSGVYLLWGEDLETRENKAYIGQSRVLRDRIKGHYTREDMNFFEHIFMFMSRFEKEPLNQTEIGYLEANLIRKSKKAKRYAFINKRKNQKTDDLEEDYEGDYQDLFDYMMSILPVVGINFFDHFPSAKKDLSKQQKVYYYQDAEGYLSGEKFVVLKGSRAKKDDVPSLALPYKEIRARLIKEKVLKDEGEFYSFPESYEFSSTSKAGAVVSGSNSRGPEVWRDENKKSIRENQIARLEGEQGVRVVDESKKLPVATQQKECVFVDKKEGIDATGYYYKKLNKKLFVVVVKKGNCAKRQGLGKLNTGSKKARKTLIESGALVAEGNFYRFTVDSKFNSPSQAAAILAGKEINGLKAWRDKESDKMLKELQES